jgi:hypothetical protein
MIGFNLNLNKTIPSRCKINIELDRYFMTVYVIEDKIYRMLIKFYFWNSYQFKAQILDFLHNEDGKITYEDNSNTADNFFISTGSIAQIGITATRIEWNVGRIISTPFTFIFRTFTRHCPISSIDRVMSLIISTICLHQRINSI